MRREGGERGEVINCLFVENFWAVVDNRRQFMIRFC